MAARKSVTSHKAQVMMKQCGIMNVTTKYGRQQDEPGESWVFKCYVLADHIHGCACTTRSPKGVTHWFQTWQIEGSPKLPSFGVLQVQAQRPIIASGVMTAAEFVLDTEAPGFWPEKRRQQPASWGNDMDGGWQDENPDDPFLPTSQVRRANHMSCCCMQACTSWWGTSNRVFTDNVPAGFEVVLSTSA
jgi:hypothetical protein